MDVYLDITLLPGDDIGHHFLWEKVFQQVHIALVENKNAEGNSPFGLTFPEFNAEKNRLGRKLRFFAENETMLQQLNINQWLDRLTDYVHITSIRPVPENVEYFVQFYPLRFKSSLERLARRAAKRHGISYEKAMEERAAFKPQRTRAPFIWTKSQSNGQRFRLFIGHRQVDSSDSAPVFSCYGLTRQGSLPQF